jgi:hypothetical protein
MWPFRSKEKDDAPEPVKVELREDTGLKEYIIQIIAVIAFAAMFYFDKMKHVVVPPLSDYWYGIASAIAVFGKAAAELLKGIKK